MKVDAPATGRRWRRLLMPALPASRERNEAVRYRLLTMLSIALSGAAALIAQSGTAAPPQDQQPRPSFRTEANFILVDAYPTHDGQPVLDLTAEDFEVVEDGRAQAVQTFE